MLLESSRRWRWLERGCPILEGRLGLGRRGRLPRPERRRLWERSVWWWWWGWWWWWWSSWWSWCRDRQSCQRSGCPVAELFMMTNTTHWWWMGSSWSLNCLGDRRIDGQKRGIPETRSGRYSLDPGWYQWYHSFIKIFIILFKKNLLVNFKLVIRLSVFQNEPWSGYYSTSLGSGGRFFIKWVLSFLTGTSILIIFHHPEKVETFVKQMHLRFKKKRSNDFMFSYT